MASFSQRDDQVLAQVRVKRGGVVVFSKSQLFPTETLARAWAERLEKKIKAEGLPQVVRQQSMSLGQLISKHLEYLQTLRQLGRSAVQNYDFMAQQMDKVRLDELTPKHLVDFAARRRSVDKVAPATILANLSAVSAAMHAAPFVHGVRVDTLPVEAAIRQLSDSGVVARSRQVKRMVDQEEEDALLEEFSRRNSMPQTEIDMARMYRVALALPRRVSELCRIRWADLDTKRRTVVVRDVKHPSRKIGNDQVVPLLGPAWELVAGAPKLGDRIFPYNSESVSAAFERVRDRIAATGLPSIKDLRFHDLRHTGITMLFWRGLTIEEVAVVSGHTNWNQLKRYTHIRPEDLHRHFDPREVGETAAAVRRWRGLKSVERADAAAELVAG